MDLVLRRGIKIPKIKQTSFVYRPEPETAPSGPRSSQRKRRRRWVLAATATASVATLHCIGKPRREIFIILYRSSVD